MNILITGHKGLIGKEVYNSLMRRGDAVIGYDRGGVFPDYSFDGVVHCAANCVIREVIADPELMMENMSLTCKVMELARKYKSPVVLMSSGRVNHDFMNPYVVSKRFLEDVAKAYNECYGVDSLIIRPETIWGKNDNPVRVIPNWISKAKKGDPLIIYGDESKELSPLHVDDFVTAFLGVFSSFDEYKNGLPVTISGYAMKATEVAETIIKVVGSGCLEFRPAELSQPQEIVYSTSDVRLPNQFETRLREVLQ